MKRFLDKLAASEADRKKNPPVTIAFLGDSVTQGCFEIYKTGENSIDAVVEPDLGYANLFTERVRSVFPKAQINYVNAGISGDDTDGGLARLGRDVLAFHPDLLIVCYGLNDATRGDAGIKRYAENLAAIFGEAKKTCPVVFMTPNTMNTRAKYSDDKLFADLYAFTAKIQNDGVMDKYMAAARETAKKCGATLCDCYAKWKRLAEIGADTDVLLSNGVNHPTPALHNLFADALFETVFFGAGEL